jgi:hypothetical protein
MSNVNNLQSLQRKRPYIGLKDYTSILKVDTSVSSDQYFNVFDFPDTLKSGKNLFKIKANAGTLVNNSDIHIEILDYNGQPIYYEVLSYAEQDGSRVVSIWIYENTPPGNATVYIAGRAAIDPDTGATIPFSNELHSPINKNIPNVLWARRVTVSPYLRNDSEIIFIKQPKAVVKETSQVFEQVTGLSNVLSSDKGSGATVKIKSLSNQNVNFGTLSNKGGLQGQGSLIGTSKIYGKALAQQPNIKVSSDTFGPEESESQPISTFNNVSELIIEGSQFSFNTNMLGGKFTILNPNINVSGLDDNGTKISGLKLNSNDELIPLSQLSTESTIVDTTGQNQTRLLSGSINFIITDIINSKRARAAQVSGFKNETDNTNSEFSIQIATIDGTSKTIRQTELSSNFTASYFNKPATVTTQQTQSFAAIELTNLSPATGDVYKVKTLFKAAGLFGDFIDLGDTILEETELLIDDDAVENTLSAGVIKNRIGYFTDINDFNTYWTGSDDINPSEVQISNTFNEEQLISSVNIQPVGEGAFNDTDKKFAYIHINASEYQPALKADTTYVLRMKVLAVDTPESTDVNVNLPRLDVYISGSEGYSIIPDYNDRDNKYMSITTVSQLSTTLTDSLEDNKNFGTRIGSIELNASASIDDVNLKFEVNKDISSDIFLIIRRGSWNVSDISLASVKESGFTPNFVKINKRIPATYFNTPLTFKFQFFDFNNNLAENDVIVYPVTFKGENTVITGTNNVLSGSLFIGSEVGSGVELDGNTGEIKAGDFVLGSTGITSIGSSNVGSMTASAILMDPVNIRSADGLVIGGAGDTFTTSGPANKFTIGGAGNISMSGSLRVNNEVITFLNLPTSDPGIPGRLYNSGGVLKISI